MWEDLENKRKTKGHPTRKKFKEAHNKSQTSPTTPPNWDSTYKQRERESVSLSKWCHKLRNWRNYIIFKIRVILDRRNVSEVLSILELRNSFGLLYDYRVVTTPLIKQKNKPFKVVPTPGAASMSRTRARVYHSPL